MSLSVVILTKNAGETIGKTLESIAFANEIIIIDDCSSDETIKKIREAQHIIQNIKIFEKKLDGDFASQRNFGLEKAKGEWVLFVDADEIVTKELKDEISHVIKIENNRFGAYHIKRRDFWWGRELRFGEVRNIRERGLIRLVQKYKKGKWVGYVHERFILTVSAGALQSYLDHFPHPTVKDFLREINMYSTLRARELFENKKKTHIFEIVFFPFAKFIYTYVVKLGFLDGAAGFAYAFFMSFHSFLVRAKLYQYLYIDRT